MPMDDVDRRAVVSIRNLTRVVVGLLILLLIAEGVPALLAFTAAAGAGAQESAPEASSTKRPAPAVTRGAAGSMRTELGYGIVLNEGSSLQREWVVVNDPASPVQIVGPASVVTVFKGDRGSREYRYQAEFEIEAQEPVAAVQVRVLVFDVCGDHERNLSSSTIEDLPVGRKKISSEWRLYSENDAEEHYASIGFVSRVRTQQGRVVTANLEPVVQEARRFSLKFNAAQLEGPGPSTPPPR